MLDAFTWYKQSTFRWKGEKLVVYIDSWGLTDDLPPADLLLITHAHGDHYAPDDIARVKKGKTVIVAPADVAKELDRKSTRLNSSHSQISYAVFCLKKKRKCRRRSPRCKL